MTDAETISQLAPHDHVFLGKDHEKPNAEPGR